MAKKLAELGMLWEYSKITKPEVLDEATFLGWYDNEHIPETSTGGVKSAIRSVDIDEKAECPYLTLYPCEDLAALSTEGFPKMDTESKQLPGSGNIFDLADFDVRYYSLEELYDPTKKPKDSTKLMMVCSMEPDETLSDDEINRWYVGEHNYQMTLTPGYVRSTRFKLVKNLRNGKVEPPAPRWLAIHELDVDSVDLAAMFKRNDLPWQRAILKHMKFQLALHQVAKLHGDKTFFHSQQ